MCVGQTLSEAIAYLKNGHKIHRLEGGHLEMVKLQSGQPLIVCVDEDNEESPGIWEPTQEDVLATDWVVE